MATRMLFLVASSLVFCACVNGLAIGANKAAPAPLVYETFADAGQYLFLPAPQSWTKATKDCRTYNGHLAHPKTQDEADALWSIMTKYNVKQIHVAFHDHFVEGEYYTAKGLLLNESDFKKWSSGAPIGGSSRNCGGLRSDGLVDVACDESHPAICEVNSDPIPDPGGFKDYTYIESLKGYYKRYGTGMTWIDGMRKCYADGAHLVIMNSEEEHKTITDKYTSVSYMPVGVHHMYEGGYFVTLFDETLESTGYTTWQKSPDSSNEEFPIVMANGGGLYTDSSTRLQYQTICEYNPPN